MTTQELADKSRELANAAFENDGEGRCTQKVSCMRTEEARPLSKAEKADGSIRRPFSGYDTNRMCLSCRCYWFQEMAAQSFHRMSCIAIAVEARK